MLLEFIALVLAGIHFGIPLIYYFYLRSKYLNRPWNINVDESYKPKVTIIIPTYREARFIRNKLDNIYTQNYPKDLIEVIIVDSASDDGTVDLVMEWSSKHRDIALKVIEEPERRGMVPALNYALRHCKIGGEVVIFTDADAFWDADALARITKYFADPNVGAVTASIVPSTLANDLLEGVYRSYYNLLRITESKLHSTPIHNGALVAFRTSPLYRMGGLPNYTGNNDSTPASIVAFMGYRAIQVDDVIVREPIKKNQFHRKVRRAQHLLLSFLKTKQYVKKLGVYRYIEPFEKIWKIEWWLHVVNPWLLIISTLLLVLGALHVSYMAITLLGIGIVLLVLKEYRTWILQQLYLAIAAVRNVWTKEIAWSK